MARRHGPGRRPPVMTDAKTAGEPDTAVHAQHLAMVSADPAKRVGDARCIVAPHRDSGVFEAPPEPFRRPPAATEPVIEHPACDSAFSRPDQRIRELGAHRVLLDDVVLEVDCPRGRLDRVEPSREVFRAVTQKLDRVPVRRLCVRDADEARSGQGLERRTAKISGAVANIQVQCPAAVPRSRVAGAAPGRGPGSRGRVISTAAPPVVPEPLSFTVFPVIAS